MARIQEDGTIVCSQCGCKCAEIRGGCLVIAQRHHGERHVSVVPISDVVQWCMDRLLLPVELVNGIEVLDGVGGVGVEY
jgi:hypothetical protein